MILAAVAPCIQNVVGTYLGTMVVRGEVAPEDTSRLLKINLLLNADGGFVFDLENHIMSNQTEHATGKYRLDGDEVVLRGTSNFAMDDGYTKTSGKKGFLRRMTIKGGSLILHLATDSAMVFSHPGSPRLAALPSWNKPPSDPRALKILAKTRSKYASLKSYRDDAAFTSLGDTETPKQASVGFRFVRSGRLVFRVVVMKPPIPILTNEIGMDATGSWMYKRGYNRGLERRDVGLSFGTVSASGDSWAIYSMLTGHDGFSADPHGCVIETSNESVDKHPCYVVVFRSIDGSELSLCIDQASYLIRLYRDSTTGQEMHHHPEANVTIPPSELKLRQPQIRGAG